MAMSGSTQQALALIAIALAYGFRGVIADAIASRRRNSEKE
jgi:hypothetical protein